MTDRTILCPCEDVELIEIQHAVDLGYEDLEAVKRLTAVTTGPCQGKWCLGATLEALAEATGKDPETLGTITHRPPVHGVPLGALAKAPVDPGPEPSDDRSQGDQTEGDP